MAELQNLSFSDQIANRYAAHLRLFLGAVDRGKDKEFTWINCLILAQFKIALLNHKDKDLFEDAWTKYKLGADFSDILESAIESINFTRSIIEQESGSAIDKYHIVDLAYYSLEEMAEFGLDKELIEFLNKPSSEYKIFRMAVKDFYSNLEANHEIDDNVSFREANDYSRFFLKSKIWFASDGNITKSYRYEYTFRPSVLKRIENVKNIDDFLTFLKMYYTQTEIVESEAQEVGFTNKSKFFESDSIITKKLVSRELTKYFASKEFEEAYPLDIIESNGKTLLTGKSKEQFESHCLVGTKILSSSWKGNKNELAALLFSLHEAGYLSGTMEDVLRTFQDLMPSEEKLIKAGRANFSKFVNPKDNNAKKRFSTLLAKVNKSFTDLVLKYKAK